MKTLLCMALTLPAPLLQAADREVTIDIQQMTCPLCVISINQALRSTDGVIKAKASMKTKQAEVIVADNVDNQRLLDAIAKTGFHGSIHQPSQPASAH
ncbi:heavy-metal-associated domain-containing protein [Shimwellia pseudoproteus]|nr:heavy-metal-associated domain-containing protein [Shimwellia pseudoproteus]